MASSTVTVAVPTQPNYKTVDIRKVENLVFKGGSVKGVAYVGALGALETLCKNESLNFQTQIKKVGGTSAGAITALLIAMNYTLEEVIDYLINTDLKSFLSASESRVSPTALFNAEEQGVFSQSQMVAGALMDLNKKFGLYSGGKFLEWLEALVKKRTNIDYCTFRELHILIENDVDHKLGLKDLYVIGFNLSSNATIVFSYQTTPDSVISDAVRISMSIPIIFLPHHNFIKTLQKLEKGEDGSLLVKKKNGDSSVEKKEKGDSSVKKKKGDSPAEGKKDESSTDDSSDSSQREFLNQDLWVDGGLTNNYPVRIFDNGSDFNENTLGFFFVSPEEIECFEGGGGEKDPYLACVGKRRDIKNGLDYIRYLFESLIDSQQVAAHLHSRDPERTVYINHLNVNSMNFALTVEEKQNLVNSGWDAVFKKCGVSDIPECPIKISEMVVAATEKDVKIHQDDAPTVAELAVHERCSIL